MPKAEIRALEEAYARKEIPVVSNKLGPPRHTGCSDGRAGAEPEHIEVIPAQRKRLGTKRGFITDKSNCSLQSYVPALSPLRDVFGLKTVLACTYQAISGAGKTFETFPEIVDNVIPYIAGEEEKSGTGTAQAVGTCRERRDCQC